MHLASAQKSGAAASVRSARAVDRAQKFNTVSSLKAALNSIRSERTVLRSHSVLSGIKNITRREWLAGCDDSRVSEVRSRGVGVCGSGRLSIESAAIKIRFACHCHPIHTRSGAAKQNRDLSRHEGRRRDEGAAGTAHFTSTSL